MAFTSIDAYTADLAQHAELTFQGDPKLKYELALFVGNEEIELQRNDIQAWSPVTRPYALHLLITYTF